MVEKFSKEEEREAIQNALEKFGKENIEKVGEDKRGGTDPREGPSLEFLGRIFEKKTGVPFETYKKICGLDPKGLANHLENWVSPASQIERSLFIAKARLKAILRLGIKAGIELKTGRVKKILASGSIKLENGRVITEVKDFELKNE